METSEDGVFVWKVYKSVMLCAFNLCLSPNLHLYVMCNIRIVSKIIIVCKIIFGTFSFLFKDAYVFILHMTPCTSYRLPFSKDISSQTKYENK